MIALGLAAPGPAAAADLTVAQAEARVVQLINADRRANGLVAYQVDNRLMQLAKDRSTNMATYRYFDHRQPDGRYYYDLLRSRGISNFTSGEIIARNSWDTLEMSAAYAVAQWKGSAPHLALMRSSQFNYFGVGLATDVTGKHYWTAVMIQGPDRTAAFATAPSPAVSSGTTSTSRRLAVSWTGDDVRLQVRTAGLASFRVERRVDAGAWTVVSTATTSRSLASVVPLGHLYEYRIRATDRVGNVGSWSTVRVDLLTRSAVVLRR
jgi:hypothetical protein